MRSVVVLGARPSNIGGAIVTKLSDDGWDTLGLDCHTGNGIYSPPSADSLSRFDACVISLGTNHIEPFGAQSNADIAKVLRGTLELPILCAKNFVKHRRGGQGGIIVFIGSYAHDHPLTHSTTYCVAKAGLDMACKSLAWELMPMHIRVHIVHPHHVQGTPMSAAVKRSMMGPPRNLTSEEADAYTRKDLRMPEILKPEEVAEVVSVLLTTPAMAWTSGQAINLYGGIR